MASRGKVGRWLKVQGACQGFQVSMHTIIRLGQCRMHVQGVFIVFQIRIVSQKRCQLGQRQSHLMQVTVSCWYFALLRSAASEKAKHLLVVVWLKYQFGAQPNFASETITIEASLDE